MSQEVEVEVDAHARWRRLQRELEDLSATDPVAGCALFTNDGFLVVAAPLDSPAMETGAVAWDLMVAATNLGSTLGTGNPCEAYVLCEAGIAMLCRVEPKHVLVVVAATDTTIGWLRVAAVQTARAIEPWCAESRPLA